MNTFYSEQILDGELAFVFLTCVLFLEFFLDTDLVSYFQVSLFKGMVSFCFSFEQSFTICKYMSCSSKNSLSLLGAAPTT